MIRKVFRLLLALALTSSTLGVLTLTARSALAAGPVELKVSPPSGSIDQEFTLSVIVKDSQKAVLETPEFQRSDIFTIEPLGRVFNQTEFNGQIELEFEYTFRLIPSPALRPGTYPLPAGTMVIDGSTVQLPRERIVLLESEGPRREGGSGKGAVDFAQAVDNITPYVGQQILYRAEIAGGPSFLRGNLDEIALNGFWRESMGDLGQQSRNLGSVTVHSLLEALYPANAGDVQIPERILVADLRKPRERSYRRAWNLMDDILGGDGGWESERRRLRATGLTLKVQPLPTPPFPPSGYIPVGLVSIHSSVDRESVIAGETVTMTIVVSGDANLRPFELQKPPAEQLKDFKLYEDKPTVEAIPTRNKVVMKKTFAVSFVPLRAGTLQLPQYELVTFNPTKREYERTATKPFTLQVTPSSSSEKLVVSGDRPAATATPAQPAETTVAPIEDLHPQMIGSPVLVRSSGEISMWQWLILFGAPMSALLARVTFKRRGRDSEAGAARRRDASGKVAATALASLGQGVTDQLPSKAFQILRRYLGERFMLPHERFSANELEGILKGRLPAELTGRLAVLLARLERSVYGGSDDADKRGLLEELRSVIEAIERNS